MPQTFSPDQRDPRDRRADREVLPVLACDLGGAERAGEDRRLHLDLLGPAVLGTVCSITFNGVLLRHGIPVASRFGGLLELRALKPTRFVELIHYEGTTLDPPEVFIRSGMTDYKGAVETGNGLVGASFREVPGNSRERVLGIARGMEEAGLGVVIDVGWPGRPLFDIPVSEGRLGVVVMGGLNPVAILEETGMRVRQTGALAGLIDYRKLIPYEQMTERTAQL
jgi:repressor of nif and glnA expression